VSTTARDFVVIGENIHATRVLLRKSERIAPNEQEEESIVFIDGDGATRHLRIPEQEKLSQAYQEGRIKHVRIAVQVAMAGAEPDCSTALSYLSTLAQRQVKAGAHFLDVNVDEISTKLDDQLEAMRWLVRELAPLVDIPLSIDSSNLEIISAGVTEAAEAAGTRVGPPMLNSASLERIEALQLAAQLRGPVVVTAAGESGMPTDAEERVINASRMVEASLAAGITLDRIFVDPLVFPIAVDSEYGRHCLDAIAELRRRFGTEIHITGGMSNVSFGLPNRRLLNDAFLLLAIEAGADSGIVDPTVVNVQRALAADRTTRPFQLALDVFTGADENCRAYMKAYRAGELTPSAS
jgi:5-methyltetrahydrofolate--homocysteine methyltransferase